MVKNPPASSGNTGLIPDLGISPGERNGTPLQYSCLGNPMDREAWWATVHGGLKELGTTESTHTHKITFNKSQICIVLLANFFVVWA